MRDDPERPRRDELFDEGAALAHPRAVDDHRRDVADLRVDREPEDRELDHRHEEREEQRRRVAARLAQTPYEVPIIRCALPRTLAAHPNEGPLAFLAKPVLPEMLTAVMRRVLHDGEATVLLVDDDPDAVRLLERMLLSLPRPYRILKAYNGEGALELMQAATPNVVFLDWIMPGMDGAALMARMHADTRLREVPVVIVSARDWAEDRAVLGTELAVQWLRPVNMAKGTRCLQSLLDSLSADYLSIRAQADETRPVV